MTTQHTAGPWSVPHFAEDCGCECGHVFGEGQQGMGSVCTIHFGGENEPREVAAANGRLIAAAPDLLAALQHIVTTADSEAAAGGEMWYAEAVYPAVEAARAAIAKATGGAAT